MQPITDEQGNYHTPPRRVFFLARRWPTLFYYTEFLTYVLRYSSCAKRGVFGAEEWWQSSLLSMQGLEKVGVQVEVTGANHLQQVAGPCVLVANHMSTLETICLPAVVEPYKECTFIVKRGIAEYPIFKHIILSREPIVVDRTNPREDLQVVLEEGGKALAKGRSVVVFPQTTRTLTLDPEHFNSIGIKLAKRANVPVVPVALKTDAWGIGTLIKEFGRIDPTKKVHMAFGAPLTIEGRGTAEHKQIIDFIQGRLQAWQTSAPSQPANLTAGEPHALRSQ